MEKVNKLSLPTTIIIASIILGGFYYVTQLNKQESVERQLKDEQEAKQLLSNKEYAAKQKTACLDIFTTEGKKWNNVSNWDYNASNDKCIITYKDPNKKTQAQCDKDLAESKELYKDSSVPPYVWGSYFGCLDGTFTREH